MTRQQITGRTMGADPYRQYPIIAAVESIRAMQNDLALLPNGGRVCDAGRRRVNALIASGHYDPIPL